MTFGKKYCLYLAKTTTSVLRIPRNGYFIIHEKGLQMIRIMRSHQKYIKIKTPSRNLRCMVVLWSVGLLPFLSFTSIQAQDSAVSKLQNLINKIEIKMPLIYGDSTVYVYNFLSSGCLSSISEVSTSKSEKMDHIITFSFQSRPARPSRCSIPRSTSTPPSDDSRPPSKRAHRSLLSMGDKPGR